MTVTNYFPYVHSAEFMIASEVTKEVSRRTSRTGPIYRSTRFRHLLTCDPISIHTALHFVHFTLLVSELLEKGHVGGGGGIGEGDCRRRGSVKGSVWFERDRREGWGGEKKEVLGRLRVFCLGCVVDSGIGVGWLA